MIQPETININEINSRDKDLVFGFVRQSRDLFYINTQHIIPEIISYVTLSYYYIFDTFNRNKCGSRLRILNNNKTITNRNIIQPFDAYSTVYGSNIIDSMTNGTYIWKFRNVGDQTYCLNIGIGNANGPCLESGLHANTRRAHYLYHCAGHSYSWQYRGVVKWQLPQFNQIQDVLTMKLQFIKGKNKGILSYKINNNDEFITFDDVLREFWLSYRMVVSANSMHKITIEIVR